MQRSIFRLPFYATIASTALLFAGRPAAAAEVFGGVAAHSLDLKVALCCYEHGTDVQFGARTAPFATLWTGELHAYAFGSVNTSGGTNFAAAGLGWRFHWDGGRFYLQPGFGVAVHDGPSGKFQKTPDRIYFGSRALFEPEVTLGWRLSPKWAAELAYVHMSHAQLDGKQNPGIDDLGVRLAYRFGQ